MSTFILDILGMLAVVSAILVITARSPVVSVMWLIAVFVMASSYLVCLGVTFVGLTYLVVYVGAVAVLFLFVVMMLNVRLSEVITGNKEFSANLPLGFVVSLAFLYETLSISNVITTYSDGSQITNLGMRAGMFMQNFMNTLNNFVINNSGSSLSWGSDVHLMFTPGGSWFSSITQVQTLGMSLYTNNIMWLFMVSLVLLLAMLGPIALCMRSPRS